MTAEKFLLDYTGYKDIKEVSDHWATDELMHVMNQYALSIVEEVVTKLNNENPYGDAFNRESYTPYRQGLVDGIDSVLDGIKNEIGE